jgi:hypothetical protein
MLFSLCVQVVVMTLSCRLFYIRILVHTMDPRYMLNFLLLLLCILASVLVAWFLGKKQTRVSVLVDACLDSGDFKIDYWVALFLFHVLLSTSLSI